VSGFGNDAFGTLTFGEGWTNPNAPNLTDFTNWVYAYIGVTVQALPLNSPWPGYAFNQAQSLVPCYSTVSAIQFVLATYNCAGHILLKITPDQQGQAFFAGVRKDMKLLEPQIGAIVSSSDNGSSNSFAVGDGMRNMTIGDLDFMRTPMGRDYLAYLQDFGPGVWGLS